MWWKCWPEQFDALHAVCFMYMTILYMHVAPTDPFPFSIWTTERRPGGNICVGSLSSAHSLLRCWSKQSSDMHPDICRMTMSSVQTPAAIWMLITIELLFLFESKYSEWNACIFDIVFSMFFCTNQIGFCPTWNCRCWTTIELFKSRSNRKTISNSGRHTRRQMDKRHRGGSLCSLCPRNDWVVHSSVWMERVWEYVIDGLGQQAAKKPMNQKLIRWLQK